MSVTLKPGAMKYRDPDDGQYKSVDVVAEKTTAELVADLQDAADDQVARVEAAGTAAVALFPDTYEAVDTLSEDLAPAYDPAATYDVGDLCTYQYQLYKCNQAITTPEASFVTAHWDSVDVAATVNDKIASIYPTVVVSSPEDYVPDSQTSNTVVIKDAKADLSIEKLSVEVMPSYVGTGTPSEENPWTITPASSVIVTVNENTISQTLPTTSGTSSQIAGGLYDVVSGKYETGWRLYVFKGNETITAHASTLSDRYFRYSFTSNNYIKNHVGCCNLLPLSTISTGSSNIGIDFLDTASSNKSCINIRPPESRNMEVSDFKTWLQNLYNGGNPLVVAYRMQTPSTVSLDPHVINPVQGTNTFSSDRPGQVSVSYHSDTNQHILDIDDSLKKTQQMIANVETGTVATKDYLVGEFIIVSDILYEVINDIVSGNEIVPGTNVVVKNIENSIYELTKKIANEDNMLFQGYRDVPVTISWEQGSINPTSGGKINSTSRIRTTTTINGYCDAMCVYIPNTMKVSLYAYSYQGITIGHYVGEITSFGNNPNVNGRVIIPITKGISYSFVVAYEDDSTIYADAADNIQIYKLYITKQDTVNQLVDSITSEGPVKLNGSLFSWESGSIDSTGKTINSEYVIRTIDYIPVTSGRTISFTGQVIQDGVEMAIFYDSDNKFISREDLLIQNSIVIPENSSYMKLIYGNTISSGIKLTNGYELVHQYELSVYNFKFDRFLDAIGYLKFSIRKGSWNTGGNINTGSKGLCTSKLFQFSTGTSIRIKIWGPWVYSVWQGDTTSNLVMTNRLVDYSEIQVTRNYVGFVFYKLDEDGQTIDLQPSDFDDNVVLFKNDDSKNSSDSNIHDVPENIGVINVINNAYQMSKIKYTTEANLPTQVNTTTYPNYIPQGKTVTGVIYSSVRNEGLYVPQCVSFDSYMTAILNPNSYIYTKTEPQPHHNALTYYGAVCSSMVGYALGIDTVIPTTISFSTYPGMEIIEDQSPYGLKLGDMLVNPGNHIMIVTDIYRNRRGIIGGIELTEQVAPFTRSRYNTVDQVQNFINSGYIAMHYHYIYKVPYVSSPWVNLDDESVEPSWNHDLSPRRGDKANWRLGETIEIDIMNRENYTGYNLYRNNTFVSTSLLPVNDVISIENLTSGSYKLCLTDGQTNSGFVYFDVIDTNETYTPQQNKEVLVTYSSQNGTPSSICFCESRYNDYDYKAVRGFHVLTDEEISEGYATVQAPQIENRDNYLMKVMYKTQFGLYSSDFTSVTLIS